MQRNLHNYRAQTIYDFDGTTAGGGYAVGLLFKVFCRVADRNTKSDLVNMLVYRMVDEFPRTGAGDFAC
ncbi:hypothetical protein D3C84_1036890 [compost metagenome]